MKIPENQTKKFCEIGSIFLLKNLVMSKKSSIFAVEIKTTTQTNKQNLKDMKSLTLKLNYYSEVENLVLFFFNIDCDFLKSYIEEHEKVHIFNRIDEKNGEHINIQCSLNPDDAFPNDKYMRIIKVETDYVILYDEYK